MNQDVHEEFEVMDNLPQKFTLNSSTNLDENKGQPKASLASNALLEKDEMPVIQEMDDDMDELMSQREQRYSEVE